MQTVTLTVQDRDAKGKGPARQLRLQNMLPCIMYRAGQSRPIKIATKELAQFINKTAGEQVIVNLQFPDGIKQAILKDFQVDPVTGKLLHADFQEILSTEKIRVSVHVVLTGEPIGVKRDKGILQHGLREIEVECLPDKIPGHITVDVSNLLINHAVHVRDLKLSDDIKVITDPDEMIASVTTLKEETATPSEPTEMVEPELAVKKGKKTDAETK